MFRILFVCTGNICRSPMAEAVLKHLVSERGLEDKIKVDSAGMISYHAGENIDERAREELKKNGIEFQGRARQVEVADFNEFDLIIGMTKEHVDELIYRMGSVADREKVKLFLDFTDKWKGQDVPDPYYMDNFGEVYMMIEDGCKQVLECAQTRLTKL